MSQDPSNQPPNSSTPEGSTPEGSTPEGSTPEGNNPAKEPTIPKSIRLWRDAYDALRALMAKYGKNMTDMTSIAIIAYAKNAAAAAIAKFRTMEDKTLFALQAAAYDIKIGLGNLRNDLYEARKSHRHPTAADAFYETLRGKYVKSFDHADDTLELINKELRVTEILSNVDPEILQAAIEKLETEKVATQKERKIRDLNLEILKALR
jgi:hypothetical protein